MKVKKEKYNEGKATSTDDNTVEYSFDDITLLTSVVNLPMPQQKKPLLRKTGHHEATYYSKLPIVLMNILLLTFIFLFISQPMGGYRKTLLQLHYFCESDKKYLWTLVVMSYFLEAVRFFLLILVFLIFLATPARLDFFMDFPIYLSRYIRALLLLEDAPGGRLSFFVHGWNAWGYCGAVRQGISATF